MSQADRCRPLPLCPPCPCLRKRRCDRRPVPSAHQRHSCCPNEAVRHTLTDRRTDRHAPIVSAAVVPVSHSLPHALVTVLLHDTAVYPSPSECAVLRGVLAPRSVALPSSLAAQSALLSSLAAPPAHLLEVRRRTDAFRPILAKEHSYVYVDRTKRSEKDEQRIGPARQATRLAHSFLRIPSSTHPLSCPCVRALVAAPPSRNEHGYVLRPNFRQLSESDGTEDGRDARPHSGKGRNEMECATIGSLDLVRYCALSC